MDEITLEQDIEEALGAARSAEAEPLEDVEASPAVVAEPEDEDEDEESSEGEGDEDED